MDEDNKYWITVCKMVLTAASVVMITAITCHCINLHNAFVNGYEEGTVIGTNAVCWVKVK